MSQYRDALQGGIPAWRPSTKAPSPTTSATPATWSYLRAGVPECAADRLAVRAGMHPGEVWAEWFEGAA